MLFRGFSGNNTVPVVTTCPPCSYLWDSHCVICQDGDPHPGCLDCEDGRPRPVPWYKTEFVASIAAATIVAVISSYLVVKLTGMAPVYTENRR